MTTFHVKTEVPLSQMQRAHFALVLMAAGAHFVRSVIGSLFNVFIVFINVDIKNNIIYLLEI